MPKAILNVTLPSTLALNTVLAEIRTSRSWTKVDQAMAKPNAIVDQSFRKVNRVIDAAMAKATAALVSNPHVGREGARQIDKAHDARKHLDRIGTYGSSVAGTV